MAESDVQGATQAVAGPTDASFGLIDILLPLAQNLRWLVLGTVVAASLAAAATFLIPPTFTARTTFLPPQQQQSAAASLLTSLGGLGMLAGGTGPLRTPADQHVALMRSETVSNRLIDAFGLMDVYGTKFRRDARRELADNTRIAAGRRDGLITVEFDDRDPQRAAAVATRYVDELRQLTSVLVLTEAQQRRKFFEDEMKRASDALVQAQRALELSGFSPGALRAEPRAAAEQYARLRAEVTSAEVRLQALRSRLTDASPEVAQAQSALRALRGQLASLEASDGKLDNAADYLGRYREFKYQETLFELFSRQYELARLDESRDGAVIQVIDPAAVPEWKSRPRRALIAGVTALVALGLLSIYFIVRARWRALAAIDPVLSDRTRRLGEALRQL
jgi:uncharacterized protein involved in exopolysaccharide biosynthesis